MISRENLSGKGVGERQGLREGPGVEQQQKVIKKWILSETGSDVGWREFRSWLPRNDVDDASVHPLCFPLLQCYKN